MRRRCSSEPSDYDSLVDIRQVMDIDISAFLFDLRDVHV